MRIGENLGGIGGSPGNINLPKGKDNQKEFKPKEREKDKDKVESKDKERSSPKEETQENEVDEKQEGGAFSLSQGASAKMVTENVGVKEMQAVDTNMAKSRIDSINKLITDNVSQLQVNGQGAFLTLGVNTPDIPPVLEGAQIQLNLTDQGLTVQFNLAHGAPENVALRLLEKGDLATLQANLAGKGIHLHEMKVGNTTIALPEGVTRAEQIAAPRSIFETEAGRRDRGGEDKAGDQEKEKDRRK